MDQSYLGYSFAPAHAAVEPGRLRFFLKAVGEDKPLYHDAAAASPHGYRAVPIPPTYLFCLEMMDATDPFAFLRDLKIDLGRVLHGSQSFAYHAPVFVGDTLTFGSKVTGVTSKKGGALTIVDISTRVTNQHDEHVADMARGVVVRN